MNNGMIKKVNDQLLRTGWLQLMVITIAGYALLLFLFRFSLMEKIQIAADFVAFFLLAAFFLKRASNKGFVNAIYLLCFLSLMLYFRNLDVRTTDELTMKMIFKPIIAACAMCICLMVGKYVVKESLHREPFFLMAVALAGPACFVLARFTSHPINGTYNWLFGYIMPSEVSKISFVAATALLLSKLPKYSPKSPGDMRKIMRLGCNLAVYLIPQCVSAALCKEFGTIALIWISMLIICVCYIRVLWPITAAMGLATFGGTAFVMLVSKKVRTRFYLVSHLEEAMESSDTYVQNQSVVLRRILKNLSFSGRWGSQFRLEKGQLPPSATTDYVFANIRLEFGDFALSAVIILLAAVSLFMISMMSKDMKDRHYMDAITVIVAVNLLLVIGGNLMITPLVGITAPLITLCSSVQANAVLFFMLGMLSAMDVNQSRINRLTGKTIKSHKEA